MPPLNCRRSINCLRPRPLPEVTHHANHLQTQADAFQQVYQRNQQLFGSQEAQLRAGTVSQEAVLTQQLVLLQAEQNLRDTQGQLSQGSVALIQSLGGGWQTPQH